jgi:uncharacterized membrane protein
MGKAMYLLTAVGLFIGANASGEGMDTLTNRSCPVMPEEAVDPAIFLEHEGKKVFFCCQRFKKMFLENPAEYVGNLPQFSSEGHGEYAHGTVSGPAQDAMATSKEGRGHSSDSTHDHASDHGEPQDAARGIRVLGKFHPLAVHFPIALILAAALAEGLFLLTGRRFLVDVAQFCIVLGALGAIASVGLGLAAAYSAQYTGKLGDALIIHRWLGLATGVTAGGAAILALLTRRNAPPTHLTYAYRATLFASAALVGLTGHFGAILVYGFEHFTW